MAAPKKSAGAGAISKKEKKVAIEKTTTIGSSKFTRFRSKNDKRMKKAYRGQGR